MKNIHFLQVSSIILLLPAHVLAANGNPMTGLEAAGQDTALLKSTPGDIIKRVINAVLTLLGSIFLVLIIYGGLKWMTSRGNAQEVEEAKKIISSAVIGLVIVVASYAITWTVIKLLGNEAGPGGGTTTSS